MRFFLILSQLNLMLLFFSGLFTVALSQSKENYPVSKYIVVDQFGYLPEAKKIAVIRNPEVGYDKNESFLPGEQYALVNSKTGEVIFKKNIIQWLQGNLDASSGDKAWWFDFSSITAEGSYFVMDVTNKVRSYEFNISKDVYKEVLKHSVRTFFYQRVGFKKEEKYAGKGWADKASHIGPLQDKQCRVYNDKDNAATERDVSGGWYDAGDYNKYTNWTANYVTDMMKAYLENKEVWTDDYNIPESGNGFPDLLDEAMWGIDHLLRIQNPDGSMISCIGEPHASPPSSAQEPSLYGTPSTSSALNSASAFAIASKVYGMTGKKDYSEKLKQAAIKAWAWADANPRVIFMNNDEGSGTKGLCAGQQEIDDYGRVMEKLEAAVFLFELTGNIKYREYFDGNYRQSHMFSWGVGPWEASSQDAFLYYTTLKDATRSVINDIKETYRQGMRNEFNSYTETADAYMANLKDYTWGSNSIKSIVGNNFMNMIYYNIDSSKTKDAIAAAEGYVHNIHGVNPLSIVYLSNMYQYGGENCVNEFYHSWFCDGSPLWDRVGTSAYGPPPGFLTGGPNPGYDRDQCCPNNCGGDWANNACNSESIKPPKGQPAQKSYKDFNTNWPMNSWSVTENSCGYQCNYIRLISKLVPKAK
jgi:endoglucanase